MSSDTRPILVLGTGLYALEMAELMGETREVAGFVENLDRDRCAEPLDGRPVHWIDYLAPLAGMEGIEYLSLWQSRSLASLQGIGPAVQVLELASCSQLATLEGLEAATGLQAVVLETCNKVTDLTSLSSLPDLRLVQLDMSKPPPLEPVIGHPALEFVWLIQGRRPADEIERLLESPALRMVNSNRATWMRTPDGWAHAANIYGMTPDQLAQRERLLAELNQLKIR